MNKKTLTFKDAIREAFEEELDRNPTLFILGEDITDSITRESTLKGIEEKFPGRILNQIPLVEDMLGGIALGMSMGGLRPVIQFDYSTFLTLALNDIYRLGIWRFRYGEKEGPGVLIRVGHEGYAPKGPDLSASFLSHIFHLPNIWIAAPAFPYSAKRLLNAAFRANRPLVFFEHKMLYPVTSGEEAPDGEHAMLFDSSIVVRSGKDITVISWAFMTHIVLQAADALASEGIELEVVSLETLYPIDEKTILKSAQKTGRVVIAEEEMSRGGIGAEIAARIAGSLPGCRVFRVAAKNFPLPTSGRYQNYILPTRMQIVKTCREIAHARPVLS